MALKKIFFLIIFILFCAGNVSAECRACPYSCKDIKVDKSKCKDYKNDKNQCCVEVKGAGVTCGTNRRCTPEERKKRGCKDYRNEKGESCIEFRN